MEIGRSVKGMEPMNTLTEMRAAAWNYASQMKIKTIFHYVQCGDPRVVNLIDITLLVLLTYSFTFVK